MRRCSVRIMLGYRFMVGRALSLRRPVKQQKTPHASNTQSSTSKSLGLEQDITRRDFLNATLLASGGALIASVSPVQLLAQKAEKNDGATDDWTGYGGVGDYANSNG